MVTEVHVQIVTFTCINFPSFECDEHNVVLKRVVHRDDEHNFIVFMAHSITRMNKITCESNAFQPLSCSLIFLHCVGMAVLLLKINP